MRPSEAHTALTGNEDDPHVVDGQAEVGARDGADEESQEGGERDAQTLALGEGGAWGVGGRRPCGCSGCSRLRATGASSSQLFPLSSPNMAMHTRPGNPASQACCVLQKSSQKSLEPQHVE